LTSAGGTPGRRLFFALWPSDLGRRELALAVEAAVRSSGGRPVPEANLHLTLAFLGNVSSARLQELGSIARQCAREQASVATLVQLQRLEVWRRPRILAATATSEPQAVRCLAEALVAATTAAGFAPDLKPFRAHVTVARQVVHSPQLESLPPVAWHLNGFALIDSRSGPSGPVYSVVESYALVAAEKLRK
jgi:RNA 2',3'-cyclic 3'-phosphodiesterase